MGEKPRKNVLRRKAEAGRATAAAKRPVLPARALSSALTKAADSEIGLALLVESCSESIASLPDLLERLPEDGLLAVLEGPEDGQGLAAFDTNFLSAVIEKQMTGMVSTSQPHKRRVTRTDAALAADLIDAMLRGFELALDGREETRWAAGFGYASHVESLRPLGLLMEEIEYRIFGLTLDIQSGARSGTALLALPAEGRGPVRRSQEADEPAEVSDSSWKSGLEESVMQGEVRLDAVLHQFEIPISAIEKMKVGDEIPIPVTAIDNVRLSGAEKTALGRCRLGRSQGRRAVRLGAEGLGMQATATPSDRSGLPVPSGGLPDVAGGATSQTALPDAEPLPDLAGLSDSPELPDLPALPDLPGLSEPEDLPDLAGIGGGAESGLPMATPMAMARLGADSGLPDLN